MSEAKLFETGAELKTKYRFIHFVQFGKDWICKNNRSVDSLGYVEYYSEWKQFVFSPCAGTVLSHDCLYDIRHFLQQLNNKKARGEE